MWKLVIGCWRARDGSDDGILRYIRDLSVNKLRSQWKEGGREGGERKSISPATPNGKSVCSVSSVLSHCSLSRYKRATNVTHNSLLLLIDDQMLGGLNIRVMTCYYIICQRYSEWFLHDCNYVLVYFIDGITNFSLYMAHTGLYHRPK